MTYTDVEAAKFWLTSDKTLGECGCWLWTGGRNGDGYGQVTMGGKRRSAHRVAWELANGEPFPAGLVATHRCDTPSCVNPAHIGPLTQAENIADMYSKGRNVPARGERNRHCRLTQDQVLEMRRRFVAGESIGDLASHFGVRHSAADNAITGRSWRHLPLLPDEVEAVGRLRGCAAPGGANYTAKLTEQKVRAMRWLAREGISRKELAAQFHVSLSCILHVLSRRTWAHVIDLPEGAPLRAKEEVLAVALELCPS